MPINNSSRIAGLVLVGALVLHPPANAQATGLAVTAPVPGQIITAKRVFISNAGSESYGSESYFRLTRYDGGPDRFYNQFYAAMKNWGRYELADSPANADMVCEVRFTSPIVDKQPRLELVYDPQLNLTFVDPKTRVALWSLTEHIQTAQNSAADNRNFDQAVSRIVDRTRLLASGSASSVIDSGSLGMAAFAPAGALDAAREQRRLQHSAIGSAVGGVVGLLTAMRVVNSYCGGGIKCASPRGKAVLIIGPTIAIGGVAAGALVGWLWPTQGQP
jgi:hypothetical protein